MILSVSVAPVRPSPEAMIFLLSSRPSVRLSAFLVRFLDRVGVTQARVTQDTNFMTHGGVVLAQGDPLYLSGSHVSNRKSGCVGMITTPPLGT